MPRQSDPDYAETLIAVLREDCRRLKTNDAWSSIVVWEAEELRRQAERLNISPEVLKAMRVLADEALAMVRQARATSAAAGAAA